MKKKEDLDWSQKNYKILIEDVSGFKQGDVVPGNQLAGDERAMKYLTETTGIVVETDEDESVRGASKTIQAQIDEAIAAFRVENTDLRTDNLRLETELTAANKEIDELNAEISRLKAASI